MTIDNKSPDAKGSLDKKSYYTAIEYLPLHQEPQGRAKSTDREADQQSKLCHDPNTIMNDFQSRYLGVNHPLNDFHGNFWTEDSRPDSTNGTIPDIGLCSIVARGNNEILGRKQMGPNDDMIINGHSGEEVRRDPGGQSDRRSSLLGFYDKEMYDIPQDPSSSRWYLDPLYWDI
ncbi:hypothetical protein CLU79DRAFT_716034 [Phycomyces nitens]|nr:hypothetical protein CLU79DRAFT_716034 [Phycomyces nitens]